MGSLDDLYETTNHIDDDVTLYCHLATWYLIMFEEAIKDAKWRVAINEITSTKKNDIWRLVPIPNRKKLIGVKWIYKEKRNTNREIQDKVSGKRL